MNRGYRILGATVAALLLAMCACARSCRHPVEQDQEGSPTAKVDPEMLEYILKQERDNEADAEMHRRNSDAASEQRVRDVKAALKSAPDEAFISYIRAELAVAKAVTSVDPRDCLAILEDRILATNGAASVTILAKVGNTTRRMFDDAQRQLLQSADGSGPQTPAFSEEESYGVGRGHFEPQHSIDIRASPLERCQAYTELYTAILPSADPLRIRMLRYLREPRD